MRFTSFKIARSYSPADCLMLWNFAIISWNVKRGSTYVQYESIFYHGASFDGKISSASLRFSRSNEKGIWGLPSPAATPR
ncbi:hypothetical protein T4B_4120 [Trichinella pseudospiralis]|uniref:Uncharacterized protein n=1 Tax=Trichinella pseudospiralis TaxID=6337 RepID=A0A0V1GRY0_TRIPS|nr:hypothetical protein T4B_4120 [Trichinella pseudospiralis]